MHSPMTRLDPCAWNLYAVAFAFTAACGFANPGDGEPSQPCHDNDDCPPAYVCVGGDEGVEGYCQYAPCASDNDCAGYSSCLWTTSCSEPLELLVPDCEGLPTQAIPLELAEGEILALHFVDVDGDGQDELAVVTATHIELLDNVDAPTISPRGVDSPTLTKPTAMVVGEPDETAGEDLIVLVGDSLWRYSTGGTSSFADPTLITTALAAPSGVIAGDLDVGPGTELLLWGEAGALVERADAAPVVFTTTKVLGATLLDLGTPLASVMLQVEDNELEAFDLSGSRTGVVGGVEARPIFGTLGSLTGFSVDYHLVTSGDAKDWRRLSSFEPGSGAPLQDWAIPIRPAAILSGDLDGAAGDDLVFLSHTGGLGVAFDPRGEMYSKHCWWRPSSDVADSYDAITIGDFDGDGDEEIAAQHGDQVVILDV